MHDLNFHVEFLTKDAVLCWGMESDLIGLVLGEIDVGDCSKVTLELDHVVLPDELDILLLDEEVVEAGLINDNLELLTTGKIDGRLHLAFTAGALPICSEVLETPVLVAVRTGGVDDDHGLLNVLNLFNDDCICASDSYVGVVKVKAAYVDIARDCHVPFRQMRLARGAQMPRILLGVLDGEAIALNVARGHIADVGDRDGAKNGHVSLCLGVVQVPSSHSEIERVSARLVIDPEVPIGLNRVSASIAAMDCWVALKVLGEGERRDECGRTCQS